MIAFIFTPIGRYITIAVIVLLALSGVYYKIRADAVADIEAIATKDALERTNAAISAGDAIRDDPARVRSHDRFERD